MKWLARRGDRKGSGEKRLTERGVTKKEKTERGVMEKRQKGER